jgi:phosphatidylinositol-bisphosphatase
VQECAYKAANGEKQDPHFDNCVKECCGDDFIMLSKHHLWEMRLYVLVRKKHQEFISNIEEKTEATGIAHILGNKGGVVTKLEVYGMSFCFISCHLAAHQGKTKDRNGNVEEIFRNARMSNKLMDISSQYHHCFLFGDLNYRIDPDVPEDADDDQKWDTVKALVDAEDWPTLYKCDQLVWEIDGGRTLAGFKDAVPKFMPTFKVERQVCHV